MAIETDADRLDMLNVLGDEIIFNGSPIMAVFDSDYFAAVMGDVEVESSQPGCICRTTDVSAAAHGDAVVHNLVSYTVVGVKHDGTGMTALVLEKV